MYPLWTVAIAPVLRASESMRVVEIGALRGETTTRMLDDLGPDGEFHVIDPAPDFDPREHETRFPGRYHFHRALSLDVLPTLGPMDAALIDGDHNWYTVYNELRLLAESARKADAQLPVLILHDVLWPYGRRDLYYAPEQIPAEHRQPYAQQGMRPGARRLLAEGGLNPTMHNAVVEGGPHNGVMTALEDFIAEHDKPIRLVVLPIYFGLAIAVEEERLARQPELAAALDRLEEADGQHELLEVAEKVRLQAMLFQHNVYFRRSEQVERAVARHLRVVKAALLNEHYLDHEVRFEHLTAHIVKGQALSSVALHDPVRHLQAGYRRVLRNRLGPAGPDDSAAGSFLPYAAMGRPQLDHLQQSLDLVRTEDVPGDLLEVGTGRGGAAIFMRAYLDAYEMPDRRVWVADLFRSTPHPNRTPTLGPGGLARFRADLNLVRDGFQRFELLDDRVKFLQGPPGKTLGTLDTPLALVRIGRSQHRVKAVLNKVYDRLAVGGIVVIDAPEDTLRRNQIIAFRRERGIQDKVERVGAAALTWRKSGSGSPAKETPDEARTLHPRLAPPAPADAVDLTIVVVMYNMRREAARTLMALSRAYQEDTADLDYEVIVVENGSEKGQRLGAEMVTGFGPEFRYLDLGAQAEPSPVHALNMGIQAGRGRNFALMIDGAHVLTPGVLKFGMRGLEAYSPTIVATQQWYVGPGQQGEAMDAGYDQDYEDRLFESINWPHAGYRLFEIGHFVGERDWFDGVWESNCLFASRELLEQAGCFDERFSVPGGGYANLELYERLGKSPGVEVTTIIGEGSFHQVHGGITTNQSDAQERRARVFGYSEDYAEILGRSFKGPGKLIHYVGRMPNEAAKRSRPRRLSSTTFADAAIADQDGRPASPVPVPEDLRWAFTDAVWNNLAWTNTKWLGRALATAPTDLVAYQEMIDRVRPDWVIEVGAGDSGRSLFLASVCELLEHGQVVTIDAYPPSDRPIHPRLQTCAGPPDDPATLETVRTLVGDDARAIVLLTGLGSSEEIQKQFGAYEPFVPEGSYVVVTDTVVNGNPVWTGFGPGPAEAVRQILLQHGEFMSDPEMEKYSLSFNPNGYLRRTRP